MAKEILLASEQITQQLQGEPEATIMSITATGRKTQEKIHQAMFFENHLRYANKEWN